MNCSPFTQQRKYITGFVWLLTFAFLNFHLQNNVLLSKNNGFGCSSEKPLLNTSGPSLFDPWKRTLFDRLEKIYNICGPLCAIERKEDLTSRLNFNGPGTLPYLVVPIDCSGLLAMKEVDTADLTFPENPPSELLPYFTLSGAIPMERFVRFFRQGYLSANALTNKWTQAAIEEQILQARNGTLEGTYGVETTAATFRKLSELNFSDKIILVVGSEMPWLEAIVLALGAKHVETLEYGFCESEHPRLSTYTPERFRQRVLDKDFELYDGAISFSSLEHPGLGRYGDALNPWGDLLASAKIDCVTKPDAFFALNVPTGRDRIMWNAHRVYGKLRLPMITANWKAVSPDEYSGNKEINMHKETDAELFVFRKAKHD